MPYFGVEGVEGRELVPVPDWYKKVVVKNPDLQNLKIDEQH